MEEESKYDKQLIETKMKIIQPGPNKGTAMEVDTIDFLKGIESGYEKQQIFRK